jgi:phosphosulfolactate phosphohydrolase-like enzyme
MAVFLQHQNNLNDIVKKASHAQRITQLATAEDIDLCLIRNTFHEALRVVDGVVVV